MEKFQYGFRGGSAFEMTLASSVFGAFFCRFLDKLATNESSRNLQNCSLRQQRHFAQRFKRNIQCTKKDASVTKIGKPVAAYFTILCFWIRNDCDSFLLASPEKPKI
jgi:hypothetical protein